MTEKITMQSPMPGVFYRRPDPDEELFATEGDSVEAGDVIGLVGVMKNFHDITAEQSGTITQYFVDNESEVDAGEELVEIEISE
ncbi:acetyl-CoA carboxylase [Haladaptatus sp. CMAA 1911]|uniref:acetyl-CoA carboxylase n=1 Tax=unclassified Haladaptatus TaxID=2622732 RepID=UPI003755287D